MAASGRICRTLATVRGLNTKYVADISSKKHGYSYYGRAGLITRQFSTAEESNLDETPKTKSFELTFEEYQKLRRKLRTTQRIAGLPIGVSALLTSSAVSAYLNPNMFDAPPEQIQPILGMDPLIFCGLCGVASAGAGFVFGSALFKYFWKFFNKDMAQRMQEREADFLQRITSQRASSFSKFEDDYYGESIKTLSDYRQWVREQRKKRRIEEKLEGKKESDQEEKLEERTAEAH